MSNIRRVAHTFGTVKLFKAYFDFSEQSTSAKSLTLRSELQCSGLSLADCPHNGRKDVADKMIIGMSPSFIKSPVTVPCMYNQRSCNRILTVDMMTYAIDNPAPCTLILISGDRDFAYAVATLRLRKYNVVIISHPVPGAHVSLKAHASAYFDWVIVGKGTGDGGRSSPEETERDSRNEDVGNLPHGRPGIPSSAPSSPTAVRSRSATSTSRGYPRRGALDFMMTTPSPKSDANIRRKSSAVSDDFRDDIAAIREQQETMCFQRNRTSVPVAEVEDTEYPKQYPYDEDEPIPRSFTHSSSGTTGKKTTVDEFDPSQHFMCQKAHVGNSDSFPARCSSVAPPTKPSFLGNSWMDPDGDTKPNCFPFTPFARQTQATLPLQSQTLGTERPKTSQNIHPLFSSPQPNPPRPNTLIFATHNVDGTGDSFREFRTSPTPKPEETSDTDIPSAVQPPNVQSAQTPKDFPPKFRPLVDQLERLKSRGVFKPLRSVVGYELVTGNPQVYHQIGFPGFAPYVSAAEKLGLIHLGGQGGKAWISLGQATH